MTTTDVNRDVYCTCELIYPPKIWAKWNLFEEYQEFIGNFTHYRLFIFVVAVGIQHSNISFTGQLKPFLLCLLCHFFCLYSMVWLIRCLLWFGIDIATCSIAHSQCHWNRWVKLIFRVFFWPLYLSFHQVFSPPPAPCFLPLPHFLPSLFHLLSLACLIFLTHTHDYRIFSHISSLLCKKSLSSSPCQFMRCVQ